MIKNWHDLPFSRVKNSKVRQVGFKDDIQVTWNFSDQSFQLSDFNGNA